MILSRESRLDFRTKMLDLLNDKFSGEIWAFHPFTETYEVSNMGRVRNATTGKLLKTFPNRQKYMMVNIVYSNGRRKCSMVHRLVTETFLNHFSNEHNIYEVNHIDGNKSNNSLQNLEWVTRQENLKHARENGLVPKPKRRFKYSEVDINDIKELHKLGFKINEISRSFNANRNYISLIVRGKKR